MRSAQNWPARQRRDSGPARSRGAALPRGARKVSPVWHHGGDEQVQFPPFPGDRNPSSGYPLPDLPPHSRVPTRQPQRGPDRALPPGPSGSARPAVPVIARADRVSARATISRGGDDTENQSCGRRRGRTRPRNRHAVQRGSDASRLEDPRGGRGAGRLILRAEGEAGFGIEAILGHPGPDWYTGVWLNERPRL
jgi:hypothetical protein